jgi:phosphatidylinositol glycan class B
VIAVAPIPGIIAVLQLGRLHPDEIYQYLEPAFFRVFGYGIRPWEWSAGLHNWGVPGVIAAVLWVCKALGIEDPWKRRALIELPQLALHGWMLVAAYRLAARRVGPEIGRWAIPFVGLYMPVLTFAGRTLGEAVSAAFLVIGLEMLDRGAAPGQTARPALDELALQGGALLGLAAVAWYPSAVPVVAALVFVVVTERNRDAGIAFAGVVVIALMLGAVDWVAFGKPFYTVQQYFELNVFTNKATEDHGVQPISYYLPFLAMLAPWAWLGFARKPSLPFVIAGASYLALELFTAHKEARFLYPGMVVLVAGAAPGAIEWLHKRAVAAVAVAALTSLPFFYLDTPFLAQRPEQFRLEAKAWPDATGLIMVNEGRWGAGGNFWLGRDIPFLTCDFPYQFADAAQDARYNRAVSWDKRGDAELRAAGFHVLEEQGLGTLYGR